MAMSIGEYNQRVQEWVNQHWGPSQPCPMCKRVTPWQLSPPVETPLRRGVIDRTPTHQALATIPLTCGFCGFVVQLNALIVGIIPGLEPAEPYWVTE